MFLKKDEIERIAIDPNDEWQHEEEYHGDEYVSVMITGLNECGERLFGVDLNSEPYLDAWIDVYATLYPEKTYPFGKMLNVCPKLYFNLVANTGDKDADRDVWIEFTSGYEMLKVYHQIVSSCPELAKELGYERNSLFD